MALTVPQRNAVIRDLLAADGSLGTTSLVKADIDAAIAAVDTWVSNNQASYLAALPTAFKNASSAAQKSLILAIVAMRRYSG